MVEVLSHRDASVADPREQSAAPAHSGINPLPARKSATDHLIDRLRTKAAAYAERIGGDSTTALSHECGLLTAELRGALARIDVFTGIGAKPQMGCFLTTVTAGEAEVMVECEYEAGSPGRTYGEPDDCYPEEPESLSIIQALVNGQWIDPEDYFADSVIEAWRVEILEGCAEKRKQAKDDAAEARWEAQQERMLEEGYP
jgi:hypothetical protein